MFSSEGVKGFLLINAVDPPAPPQEPCLGPLEPQSDLISINPKAS